MFLALIVQNDSYLCHSALQVQVPGRTHNTVLKNLQPDTDYTVTVVPVYSTGEGKPESENGKTCKHHLFLIVFSEWEVRILSWMLSRCDILGRDDQTVFLQSEASVHICPEQSFWPELLARCKRHASRTSDKTAAHTMVPNLKAKTKAIALNQSQSELGHSLFCTN